MNLRLTLVVLSAALLSLAACSASGGVADGASDAKAPKEPTLTVHQLQRAASRMPSVKLPREMTTAALVEQEAAVATWDSTAAWFTFDTDESDASRPSDIKPATCTAAFDQVYPVFQPTDATFDGVANGGVWQMDDDRFNYDSRIHLMFMYELKSTDSAVTLKNALSKSAQSCEHADSEGLRKSHRCAPAKQCIGGTLAKCGVDFDKGSGFCFQAFSSKVKYQVAVWQYGNTVTTTLMGLGNFGEGTYTEKDLEKITSEYMDQVEQTASR